MTNYVQLGFASINNLLIAIGKKVLIGIFKEAHYPYEAIPIRGTYPICPTSPKNPHSDYTEERKVL